MKDLKNLTEQVIQICKEADQQIIEPLRSQRSNIHVEEKDDSGRNFVTTADKGTEDFLIEKLKKLFPEAGFIAEESFGGTINNEFNWIIDPIDGTTNFMHNMPPFCISVAFAKGEEVQCGVIYEIFSKEIFHAWKSGGAYANGQSIKVSNAMNFASSLLVTGFPYDQEDRFEEWIKLFADLTKESQGVRRLGAAAVDMAYVACGRFDGFYEYNLNAWDVAAGSIICEEAGALVSDFKGGNDFLFGGELIAANPAIHRLLLDRLGSF